MSISGHCECQERGVNIKTLQVNRRGRLLHSMTENKILIYLHDTYWWRSLSSVTCYEEGVVFRFVRNHVIDFTRTDFHSHWIKYSYQRHFMLITTTFFQCFGCDDGHCSWNSLPTTANDHWQIFQITALCYPGIYITCLSSERFDFLSEKPESHLFFESRGMCNNPH